MGVRTKPAAGRAIRPFTYKATDAELKDLRRRIAATLSPDKEIVSDRTQGAQLAKVQKFVHYWAADGASSTRWTDSGLRYAVRRSRRL